MSNDDAEGGHDLPQNLDAILGKIKIDRENARRYKSIVRTSLSLSAFCLGWWGFITRHEDPLTFVNVLQYAYQTFQLLTFNMPSDVLHSNLPWQLQVTRFALPGLALYATLGLYLDRVRRPLRTMLAVRQSGHLIVVGGGARAMDVIRRCVAQGHSIIVIASNIGAIEDELYDLGVAVMVGETGNPTTFVRAGIARAHAVLILANSDSANLRAMLAVHEAVEQQPAANPPLRLACEVADRELSTVLSSALSERRGGNIESHVIDFTDNIARHLVMLLAPVLGRTDAPHVLVIGNGDLALHVLRKIALNAPERARITVVASDAEATSQTFHSLNPGAGNLKGLRFISGTPGAGCAGGTELAAIHEQEGIDAVVVCTGGGDEVGAATALSLCRWRAGRAKPAIPILVRQQAGKSLIKGVRLTLSDPDQARMLSTFGDLDQECAPDLLLRGTIDAVARAVHAAYSAAAPADGGAPAWSDLAETFREACRHQADHMVVKLALIGLEAVPGQDPADLGLDAAMLERLAEIEHWRWCVSRWFDGWTLGEAKDAALKISPYLVPYPQLSEDIKEFDRDAVRNIPALLKQAGLSVRPPP
ncbi:hypothetical protein MCP1_30068 [Candidatus Terasakiella magnetica]|nr:hypothetical protein MCP1_30068 [Candidatus Terasakiella magnetica]